jgi:hypothetical protein
MFNLITDLPLLRRKIIEVGDVNLVQIDPISSYLGHGKSGIDSYRDTEVRSVLAPLVDLARDLNVAIVGMMHFNKKIDVANAMLRISNSLAFSAAARHVYAVVDDPENKRKLMVKGKNNLARHNVPALAYTFGTEIVGVGKITGNPISAPHIVWLEQVDVTATDAMAAANGTRSASSLDAAKKFLAAFLALGPKDQTEVQEAAEQENISLSTLRRAKALLAIVSTKKRKKAKGDKSEADPGWTWALPSPKAA